MGFWSRIFSNRKKSAKPKLKPNFKFSRNSRRHLKGVNPLLVKTAEYAIANTHIDFGISSGVRTAEQQNALFKKGVSKCDGYKRISPHQDRIAIDIYPVIAGVAKWDQRLFAEIAVYFKRGAEKYGVRIVWGGSWYCLNDISEGDIHLSIAQYCKRKKQQGGRPFVDCPHFQFEMSKK